MTAPRHRAPVAHAALRGCRRARARAWGAARPPPDGAWRQSCALPRSARAARNRLARDLLLVHIAATLVPRGAERTGVFFKTVVLWEEGLRRGCPSGVQTLTRLGAPAIKGEGPLARTRTRRRRCSSGIRVHRRNDGAGDLGPQVGRHCRPRSPRATASCCEPAPRRPRPAVLAASRREPGHSRKGSVQQGAVPGLVESLLAFFRPFPWARPQTVETALAVPAAEAESSKAGLPNHSPDDFSEPGFNCLAPLW